MGNKINVNTEAVKAAAIEIETINNRLDNDFSKLDNAMKQLDKNWDGSAADNAITKFNEVKNNFVERRSTVISNMANFMRVQVGENYEVTEKTVESAASQFK